MIKDELRMTIITGLFWSATAAPFTKIRTPPYSSTNPPSHAPSKVAEVMNGPTAGSVQETQDPRVDGGQTYAIAWQIGGIGMIALQFAGGHVALVANAYDGLLYRGLDGNWRRLGSPYREGLYVEEPPRLSSDQAPFPYVPAALVIGTAVLLILMAIGLVRSLYLQNVAESLPRLLLAAATGGTVSGLSMFLMAIPHLLGISMVMLINSAALGVGTWLCWSLPGRSGDRASSPDTTAHPPEPPPMR